MPPEVRAEALERAPELIRIMGQAPIVDHEISGVKLLDVVLTLAVARRWPG